jgi:hypothetical protein
MINCYNQLELKCDDKQYIYKFYKENYNSEKQPISFERQAPVKKCDDGSISCFDSIEKWGTKHDTYDFTLFQMNAHKLMYCFHTVSSPPTTWLCNIAEKYPHIRFELEYKLGNSEYWGKQIYEDGYKSLEDIIHSTDSNSPRIYKKTTCTIH